MNFRPLMVSLLISVVAPLIIVEWLLHRGTPVVTAYLIAAIPPLVMTLASSVRGRIEALGIIALVGLVGGLVLTFVSGNPVFAVAKESIFTGIIGLAFLVSLLLPRPLTFLLGAQMNAGDDTAKRAAWSARWAVPAFRRGMRLTTAVWGAGLLVDALARVALALTLSPANATAVASGIAIAVFGGLILWTRRFAADAARRPAAE